MNNNFKVENKKEYDFSECLYNGSCEVCGGVLSWEANFDADGTSYYAICCNNHYFMTPSKVKVFIEKSENE